MNILMILDGEFPPDDRVEKEALSLIREMNNVFILCLNFGNHLDNESYKRISIKRLRINRTLRNKIMAPYLVLPFYRMFWTKAIMNFINIGNIDVMHVHDLPLTDIAIKLKKSHGIRVVCDQHEFYSNWIVNTAHYNTAIGKIVKSLSDWGSYEKENLSQADLVVTVGEPLKKIYKSTVGLDGRKIVVLPNTPNASIFDPDKKDDSIEERYRNNFVIFYAGSIDMLSGINTVIEALPLLRESIPNIKFVFAGRFMGKYYNPISYIEKLAVGDLTDYLGFLPVERLPFYIAASDVCIHVPPAISTEVINSIATKIYQYVLMNKPLIVGQARMMKQFVEDNRIGLSIADSDPKDFSEKIKLLHSSPDLIAEFVSNTRKIAATYSWEVTSRPFIESYKKLGS